MNEKSFSVAAEKEKKFDQIKPLPLPVSISF